MNVSHNGLTSAPERRNIDDMLLKSVRLSSPWRLNIVMWSIFSVLFFLRSLLHLDPFPSFWVSVFNLVLCLVLSSVLITTYNRLQHSTTFGVKTAAWIIGLSLGATVLQSAAAHGLLLVTGWYPNTSWSMLDLWLLRMMFFWLVYMAWSLFYFWLRAERNSQEIAAQITEAQAETQRMELQLLRSQLDPHFLFNALNGIATVVQTDSPPAASMVRELADYLRYSLDHQHDTMVRLDREIEAMMGYLHIEQARFGEELHIEITTEENARQRQIPCFLLLPLVENAVKHSYQDCEPPWNVTITAEMQDDTLHIVVANTGRLMNETEVRAGVGLDILRRRLALHYPDRHHFALSEVDGLVLATLDLKGDPCSA